MEVYAVVKFDIPADVDANVPDAIREAHWPDGMAVSDVSAYEPADTSDETREILERLLN